MRKLLFVAFVLIPLKSWAQWQPPTLVATGQSRDGTTATAVTNSINDVGAKLWIGVIAADSSCTSASIIDSQSNRWNFLANEPSPTTGSTLWFFWMSGSAATSTAHTFTPNLPTGCTLGYPSIAVIAVGNSGSGTTTGAHLDQKTVRNSTTSPVAAATITPTANNEIIFSAAGMAVSRGTWTSVGNGFTIAANLSQQPNAYGLAVAYDIQTTATAVTPSWAYTGTARGPSEAMNVSFFNAPGPSTINAATCSIADTENAVNAASNGDTVQLPTGTCSWAVTSPVTLQFARNTTFKGNTVCTGSGNPSLSNLSCTDNTILQYAPPCGNGCGSHWMNLVTAATGTFEVTGITFKSAYDPADGTDVILLPTTTQVRVDHTDFVCTAFGQHAWIVYSGTEGLFDHNVISNCTDGISIYPGNINAVWAAPTNFGGHNFFFAEDNYYIGTPGVSSVVDDCTYAGRAVFRFNTWNASGIQTHPTLLGNRGCRAIEQYMNKDISTSSTPNFVASFISSGTQLVWGNNAGTADTHFMTLISERRAPYTYDNFSGPPTDWGWCGTAGPATPVRHGSVTTRASNYDQNTNRANGYRCLDDVGEGQSDLLTGSVFPFTNSTNGCDYTMSCVWPHQQQEPIYEWGNKWTCNPRACPSTYLAVQSDVLTENVDYYLCQTSNHALGVCDTFNGTVGVGMGTRASRPSTCTTGVTYFSVDQGSWNAGNLGTGITIGGKTFHNGVLDKCTATNTWTNAWYVPYTYPHPLQGLGLSRPADNKGLYH